MKKYLFLALMALSVSTFADNETVENLNEEVKVEKTQYSKSNGLTATLFYGSNFNGKLTIKNSSNVSSSTNSNKFNSEKSGSTFGAEVHKEIVKFSNINFELGVGVKYETSVTPEDNAGDTLASGLPVYGSTKLIFPYTDQISIFLQGTLGYNFPFKGDSIKNLDNHYTGMGLETEFNGGLYTGIGAGIETDLYNLGLTYSITNYEYKVMDSSGYAKSEIEYSKLSLTVGYKFKN